MQSAALPRPKPPRGPAGAAREAAGALRVAPRGLSAERLAAVCRFRSSSQGGVPWVFSVCSMGILCLLPNILKFFAEMRLGSSSFVRTTASIFREAVVFRSRRPRFACCVNCAANSSLSCQCVVIEILFRTTLEFKILFQRSLLVVLDVKGFPDTLSASE